MENLEIEVGKIMNWRRYFSYINYEWENCEKWKEQWAKIQSQSQDADHELQRRIYYRETVDSDFDVSVQLSEADRNFFILSSKFETSLGSLHSESFFSAVKCGFYLFFLLLLPIN